MTWKFLSRTTTTTIDDDIDDFAWGKGGLTSGFLVSRSGKGRKRDEEKGR
jgi:hypothetical protein